MVTISKNLDMTPGGVPTIINVSQYDDDFTIIFTLISSDNTLSIESGTTAEIRGTKVTGTGYSATAFG